MGISVLRNIGHAIRKPFLSKERIERQKAKLLAEIEEAELVEEFFKFPVWEKIIGPWLKDEEIKADRVLKDYMPEMSNDVASHFERGRFRLIENFRAMLQDKLNLKTVAQQKLLELQFTGEKDG